MYISRYINGYSLFNMHWFFIIENNFASIGLLSSIDLQDFFFYVAYDIQNCIRIVCLNVNLFCALY